MARPKKSQPVWAQTVKQIAEAHGVEAVDEMLKEYVARLDVTGMELSDFEHLLDDYELIPDGDKRFLRPKLKHRLNILFELAQYSHAKLRSVETKGQIDYNFNVTIKQFGDDSPKRVNVVDVTPAQIAE